MLVRISATSLAAALLAGSYLATPSVAQTYYPPPPPPPTSWMAPPTDWPSAPPTWAPVRPTMAPVRPTWAPVRPTKAPVRPTKAPVTSTPSWAPVTDDPTSAPSVLTEAPAPGEAQGELDCSFVEDLVLNQGSVVVRQVTNPIDETLTMELVYAGQAWVSIAFSENGEMIGSTAVIALPDDDVVTGAVDKPNPGLYFLGDKDPSAVLPLPADEQVLDSSSTFEQNATHTTLRFTVPLAAFDLTLDGSYTFLFAVGFDNTLSTHQDRGSFPLTLSPCRELGAPTGAPTDAPSVSDVAVTEAPSAVAAGGELDCSFANDQVLESGTVVVRQVTNPDDETLTMELEYAGQGWVAIGFSEDGAMVGSTAVIALPDDDIVTGAVDKPNPGLYFLGAKDPSGVQPVPADEQVLDASSTFVQNATHTTLRFTIPLAAFDLTLDGSHTFLYAYGFSNALDVHGGRGSFEMTLSPCRVLGAPTSAPSIAEVALTDAPSPAEAAPDVEENPLTGQEGELDCSFAQDLLLREDGSVILRQVTDPVNQTLTMELEYAGQAWIAVGFSDDGAMIDSTAVIALPDDDIVTGAVDKPNSGLYILGSKAPSGVQPLPAAQQVLDASSTFVQNATHTTLKFTIPLTSFDLTLDGTHTFLYAFGSGNALDIHSGRGSFQLTLSPCRTAGLDGGDGQNNGGDVGGLLIGGDDGIPYLDYWKAHGFLMAISWGALVPIAIGSSLLRHVLKLTNKGLWFQIHRSIMVVAALCVVSGFALAVIAVNKVDGSKAEHFVGKHQKIGLTILVLALVQVLMGILRPHLPSAKHASDKGDVANEKEAVVAASSGDEKYEYTEQDAEDSPEDATPDTAPPSSSTPAEPALKKSPQRVAFEVGHRLLAMVLIGLAWYNVDLGISTYEFNFAVLDSHLARDFWIVAGGLTGIIAILYLYQSAVVIPKLAKA
jgi:DOMON domain/Eukaryotic cytochrome b561